VILEQSEFEQLADATLVVHAVFVGFVVIGQLLILAGWIGRWAWTRHRLFRVAHLGAIGFVVMEVWVGIPCPLTVLEQRLRVLAGSGTYEMSFIGVWLNRLLFYAAPGWVFTAVYSAFALLVAATFLAYPPRRDRGTR
jgi:polyferredoxin